VKCSTSRYHLRVQDRPELPTRITRVLVTIFAPPPGPARRASPRTQGPAARSSPVPARHQKRPGHPYHGQPARTRLGRTRPRGHARHQAPQHAHPARRMDPPGLPRQDRARQVRPPRTDGRAGHSLGKPENPNETGTG
jgi:hypothetical protein